MLLVGRRRRAIDIWPGFVDALAALLMVVMFVLLLFSVGQYLLSDALVGRDQTLDRLRSRISGLAEVLAMERKEKSDLQERMTSLSGELEVTLKARDESETRLADMTLQAQESATELERVGGELQLAQQRLLDKEQTLEQQRQTLADRDRTVNQQRETLAERDQVLSQQRETLAERDQVLAQQRETLAEQDQTLQQQRESVTSLEAERLRLQAALETSQQEVAEQRTLLAQAEDGTSELNNQIAALNEQLSIINQALELSEEKLQDKDVEIEDLGRRLNLAMANKVEELSRYRSDFFGKLREALSDNPDVRIEGDRFVLPSEVLFSSASADLDKQGIKEISTVARTLKEITQKIPDDIDWVLRVDGHTDRRPIRKVFASNWELSSARAISIVKYMISQGIPAEHLVAAGFGQYHPIDPGDSVEAYRRNRRIELKLTSR